MGIASSKNNSESLNWDKINTESMSSSVPNLNTINKDAQKLVSNLNIEENIDLEQTESDNENIFTWIRKLDGDQSQPQSNHQENVSGNNTEDFSDTSPFISSDMYKYLMNNNSSETSVGNLENNQVGGAKDSSTSSTSSSSDKKPKNKKRYTESSDALSGGNLSYISSSAHTEHNSSEEYEATSVSASVNNNMLTTSVNTSDINLISEE
jgi:hypothetical protein